MGIFDFLTPKSDGLAYDPMRLPAGADPENDPVVGYDELGQKVRRSRFDGTEYLFEVTAPKTQSVIKGAYREATANPLGFAGDLLSNAVQSAWDAISVPARSMAGEPITYGDIAGLTGMMTLGAGAGTAPAGALRMGAAREGRPPVTFADAERAMQETPGIRAYQGSPYNFAAERLVRMPDGSTQYIVGAPDVLPDVPAGAEVLQDFPMGRVRMDKINTGEGAQGYGYGAYAAENETIGRTYRDKVSAMQGKSATVEGRNINWDNPYETAAFEVMRHGGDREAAAKFYENTFRNSDVPSIIRSGVALPEVKSPGRMYELNINADPNAMLDWDKPLGQQSEAIRSAFASLGTPERLASVKGENAYRALQDQSGAMDWPVGANLAERNAVRQTASENVRQKLLEAGIPGIKYLDQGSRGAGAGSRNYVVFDEKLISIVRKYGIAGAAVMLGTSADQIAQTLTENMTQEELNNLVSGA